MLLKFLAFRLPTVGSPRRIFLFFTLAKAHLGGQGAEPQRNCGPLLSAVVDRRKPYKKADGSISKKGSAFLYSKLRYSKPKFLMFA
jgi:hypothetical protein